MSTIYQTTITSIGVFALDALQDGMLITFREGGPADLADYCFIHSHGDVTAELAPGQTLLLGQQHYTITAVGDVATQNLRELGHITIRFDGTQQAELPGSIHVTTGSLPEELAVGDTIKIIV